MQGTELCTQHTMAGPTLAEQFWLISHVLCLPAVVSAEFMVSCEKKRLGSSADFRWRCLWTLVKFQGSHIWKRLLAEKPHVPPTSLSIWMLPPV